MVARATSSETNKTDIKNTCEYTPGGGYPTIRSRPAQKLARSTFLSTLPTPVIGSSLTN